MPYKRKDSPVWWVFYIGGDGKRIRRSTGTADRKEAEALEAKWKLEAYRLTHWQEPPSRSFDDLMLTYLKGVQSEKRPWGYRRDLDATRHLKGHFRGMDLNHIRVDTVRTYIEKRKGEGVCASTINRELSVFSSAINTAKREWGWNIPNPISGRKLKEPEGRVRWLSKSEASTLIEAARRETHTTHLPDFIRLALHTGMRKGELLHLEWKRVDLQAGLIHLEGVHTKTGRRRSVPLNVEARAALLSRMRFRAQHCPASPWVFAHPDGSRMQDIKRAFATACKRASIEDFRVHDLRHTCAAWLVSAGATLAAVRDLLGHTSVKTTERYAHLSPDNVRAAVSLLERQSSRSVHAPDSKTLEEAG